MAKSSKKLSFLEMRKSAMDLIQLRGYSITFAVAVYCDDPVIAVRLYSDILCSLNAHNPNYVCPIKI